MLSFYEKNIIMFNKQSPIYIYIHIYYTRIYIRNFITNKDFVTYHKLKDFFFFLKEGPNKTNRIFFVVAVKYQHCVLLNYRKLM